MLSWALPLAMLMSVDVRPAHRRPDPFGGTVEVDRGGSADAPSAPVSAAPGSYASFQLVVKLETPGPYEVNLKSPLPADAFREWFHMLAKEKRYVPDALIPVRLPYRSTMPEPDNRIPNQTAHAFWIDVWVPPDTAAGKYGIEATTRAGSETKTATTIDHANAVVGLRVHP